LVIHQLAGESCDQSACCLWVSGGKGVLKGLFDEALLGKPGTRPRVERVDAFGVRMAF
jgi:hypothetical protein